MKTDNELIAEFMGLPLTKKSMRFSGALETIPYMKWKYHESWDWLMPVVEKIYLMRDVELKMSMGQLGIRSVNHGGFFGSSFCIAEKTAIECWHMSIVEFIKWYNSKVLTKQ